MKTAKPTAQVAPIPAAALCRADASAYVALSESTFEKLIREGLAPAPRRISHKRVVWLRRELDEWLESLPVSDLLPPPNTGRKPMANVPGAAHKTVQAPSALHRLRSTDVRASASVQGGAA